jgi:hypothetical protein
MTYIPNPQHRNTQFAQAKSQWIISTADELTCYTTASSQGWGTSESYWGVHTPGGSPVQLGVSPQSLFDLFMAKFVGNQGQWHGYPVAHWLSPFDKPPADILKKWQSAGFINRAKLAKIHKGKKCSL